MQHIILPIIYNLNRWRKIKPKLAVLADAHHESCPDCMIPVKNALARSGYKIVEIYFDVANIGGFAGFRRMAEFMGVYAEADILFICDYFLPVSACKKKKGTKVVQLWHGAGAFKKFGFDCTEDISDQYRGNPHRNYDLVTVSGDLCVGPFKSAMGITADGECRVLPIGMSQTDKYFDRYFISACRDKFRFTYPDAVGKKIILWAPTFRGNAGESRLCGEEYIDALIERCNHNSEYYVIKSYHPHLRRARQDMSTDELMVCADVLITDYSSVFFDYLLLDRPIIFFAPDYSKYKRDRGFYLDYDSLPGYIIRGCHSEDVLVKAITNCFAKDENKAMRESFRAGYMNGCDGAATERIINYVKGNKAL